MGPISQGRLELVLDRLPRCMDETEFIWVEHQVTEQGGQPIDMSGYKIQVGDIDVQRCERR
eukprot:1885784-Prorocentrum_lima.AAC.1